MTAKGGEDDKLKGYDLGADDYMTKPFSLKVLLAKANALFTSFICNPGQIFSREQLLNRIWGYVFEGTTRTVDTHIKTLRQKLGGESKHIVTLIRSGYKFEVME